MIDLKVRPSSRPVSGILVLWWFHPKIHFILPNSKWCRVAFQVPVCQYKQSCKEKAKNSKHKHWTPSKTGSFAPFPDCKGSGLVKLQCKSAHLTPKDLRACTSCLKLVANTKENCHSAILPFTTFDPNHTPKKKTFQVVELRLLSRPCFFFDLSEDRLDFFHTSPRHNFLPQPSHSRNNQPETSRVVWRNVLGDGSQCGTVGSTTGSHLPRMWLFWVLPVEVTSETSVFFLCCLDRVSILKMLDHPTSVQKNVFAGTFCWVSRPISFSQFQSRKIPLHLSEKSLPMSSFSLVPLRDPLTSASLLRLKKNCTTSSWMRLRKPQLARTASYMISF